MGLGRTVEAVTTEHLQSGDRVLFYTDGVVETRSPEGEQFGVERLADLLVRATNDGVFPAETVRRLSASIMSYNGAGLSDDATLLVIDYHGPRHAPGLIEYPHPVLAAVLEQDRCCAAEQGLDVADGPPWVCHGGRGYVVVRAARRTGWRRRSRSRA